MINDKLENRLDEENATVILLVGRCCKINHHFYLEHYDDQVFWRIFQMSKMPR